MKSSQSAWVRALCSIVIGALLIKYREQTVTWMTIAIGVLFLVSGVISCASYIASRRNEATVTGDPNVQVVSSARFPIVGIGSLVLGIILAAMPATFVGWLMYILAAMLMLGSVSQFVALAATTKIARVGAGFWVMPSLIFLVGLVMIVKPSFMASAPLLILGLCMVIYGLTECINTIQMYRLRKAYEKVVQQAAETVALESEEQTSATEDA